MSKRKTSTTIVVVSLLIIFLIGKSNYAGTLEKAMNKANIYARQIVYILDFEKGTVIFYESVNPPNTVHVGLIEKTLLGYNWASGTFIGSFDTNDSIAYGYSNIGKSYEKGDPKTLPIISGVILDDNIELITLEFRDGSYEEANIIQIDIGKVWYFFPNLEVDYIPKIVGYGKNGEILFEN